MLALARLLDDTGARPNEADRRPNAYLSSAPVTVDARAPWTVFQCHDNWFFWEDGYTRPPRRQSQPRYEEGFVARRATRSSGRRPGRHPPPLRHARLDGLCAGR